MAHASGALRTKDLARVMVDTTVQPKNVTFPTDAKLLHAAINGLTRLAKKHGVQLRQSYLRIAKRAAMMAGRYAHAKQFNRHHRELAFCASGSAGSSATSGAGSQATRRSRRHFPGRCLAPTRSARSSSVSVAGSCIPSTPRGRVHRRGKASAPDEFGVKASIVTTNARAPGGQFVLHARAMPGNPYDGHTLRDILEDTQRLTGREIERAYVDKGYRGHDAANPRRVFISGQKRGVFGRIKRELRRRSAIEAVIGHMKAEGHLGRCYLKGRAGDAANAILSAVGYNLRLLLAWLRMILRVVLLALVRTLAIQPAVKSAS